MALTLGELSGIISLNEKPALASLGRVRRGMNEQAKSLLEAFQIVPVG